MTTARGSRGRFCSYAAREDRFWEKIEPEPNSGCWLWTGAMAGEYGLFYWDAQARKVYAHRAAYQLYRGQIPNDLQIDHLCRNRLCVNPQHLEAVTCSENIRRSYKAGRSKHASPARRIYNQLPHVMAASRERARLSKLRRKAARSGLECISGRS